ncbi:hypothetical protein [Pseudomonas aeruginosa]|uniref:Virion structural protein n=1 Tax=Pseudomonas phage vB_PaeM_FBPa36 TaxID=3231237 RepID=A0AAU8KW61_9VIRU|nr:hypothetical protein [Pseudomonas aeruginosa]MBW6071096.1 hypothetical protein [Pseudomonas aeruginosa]USL86575.1 hypothetical protein CDGHABPJ_00112 [Pseudomonas phage OMKO1]WNV49953.1 hypothetical protein [Pseudomonas phage ANB1]
MITFKIRNPNSRSITSIEVYRELSGTPIPDTPINQPIQKLDGFTTAIIDRDVVIGNVYDYRIRTVREGGDTAISPVFTFKAVSQYGPGGFLEPMMQADGAALLDRVTSPELPSLQDLLMMFNGQSENAINWTDQWTKIKHKSDIYFLPYMGYIEIPIDKLSELINNVDNNRTIVKGNCKYSFYVPSLPTSFYMQVMDGRFVGPYTLPADYPRKSMIRSISDQVNKNADDVRVIMTVVGANSTRAFKDLSKYGSSTITTFNPTIDANVSWYWKPILNFIQESGVN